MKRRTMLATAVAAGATGIGVAWWRNPEVRAAGVPDAALTRLWTQSFDRPEGGQLALQDFRGTPLLLNFWATWCPPCLKEMPLLNAFERREKLAGWHVVGLAVDSPTPVRDYLKRLPMDFAIGLAGMQGVDLTRQLGNASGALPFTVVFGRNGAIVEKKLGSVSEADLNAWATRCKTGCA